MSDKRIQRMCSAYEKELAQILLFNTRDPRLLEVSITRVFFTPDLRLAKIYFSVAGGRVREREVIEGFEHSKGYLKKELAQRVQTKFVPDLKFYYDETQEQRDRMDRLFYQLEGERNGKSEKD